MSKHTEGPWLVGAHDRNEQPQVVSEKGALVAVCAHECLTSRIKEAEANARLIAAAPEMYAELRRIHDRLVDYKRIARILSKAEEP